MPTPVYDVTVLGGGPAGSACAISLRQRWPELTVAVVEASQYGRPRAGEILAPQAWPLLHQLGINEIPKVHGLVAQSVASAWGDSSLSEQHHLFSINGFGLHIDRCAIDHYLSQIAQACGSALLQGVSFHAAHRDANIWTIHLRGAPDICSRFVVDATGRHALFARSQRAQIQLSDRLTAYSLRMQEQVLSTQSMLIETCSLGWWYSAPLPNSTRIVSLLTDVDLARAEGLPARPVWARHLARTKYLSVFCGDALTDTDTVQVAPAFTATLSPLGGEGWLAAGDAAASYDPLAGQGITKALRTGILASYVTAESLAGRQADALRRYEAVLYANLTGYRRAHRFHYQRETRWPDQPFWQRRQSSQTPAEGFVA